MGRLKQLWKAFTIKRYYTRRQLKNIHMLAMSDAYVDDNGVEYTEIQTDVFDMIIRGYRAEILQSALWALMVGLMACLVLWRG